MAAELVKGKITLIFLICMFASLRSPAQVTSWQFSQIDSLTNHAPKPLLILLSTDWCQYCLMQKHQLQKNKNFQKQDSLFYFVNFDAESKETIKFNGKDYQYKPNGAKTGTHELAIALNGANKLSFPTWLILDTQNQIVFRHNGLLLPKDITQMVELFKSF